MKKLVIVRWLDAASDGDAWLSMKEIAKHKLSICASVGWIIEDNDKFIHLVPNISVEDVDDDDEETTEDEAEGFGGILIPWVNIITVAEIDDGNEEIDEGDECD